MSDNRSGEDRRETNGLDGGRSIVEGVVQLRPYGRKIVRLYHNRREDIEDVLQDAALKLVRWIESGQSVRRGADFKPLYRRAVKSAAIDLLRKRFGRPDKEGRIKNPRRQVDLKSTAFESAVGYASASSKALQAEFNEWTEVIRRQAGDRVALIFQRKRWGLSDREIGQELGLDLRAVKDCLAVAREIVERFRLEKRYPSA